MLKTLEKKISGQEAPPALQAEFDQHDFEKLRNFCSLTYIASIAIWLLFDVIVSTKGGQGFTGLSLLFLSSMVFMAIMLRVIRKARHFDLLNLIFVAVISLGIRQLIEGLPLDSQPVWMVLATASILYCASVLPLSRWAFLGTALIAGIMLNPFLFTDISIMDLRGTMILGYYAFLSSLTLYCFFKLRRIKLYNYTMSKLLMTQAYIDTLTEIPNRRSFMAKAGNLLLNSPREHDHYLAMIDIDNFKKVNDVHGHDVGDEVLKRTAATIKAVMNEHEYARLGGEEFAVYMAGVRREDVDRLMMTLCAQVREDPHDHPITISIGLARVKSDDTLNQALAHADKALYASKHNGKDRFTFYTGPA